MHEEIFEFPSITFDNRFQNVSVILNVILIAKINGTWLEVVQKWFEVI